MAEAAAVAAAKLIGSALITEAQFLYGVEDQLRALQRDLLYMQEFLQNVDANPNLLRQDGQLRILTLEMRELAFQAEDAIDTYLVDVKSKIYSKNFLLKILCLASHSYPLHMLRKKIEGIQQDTKDAMNRSDKFRISIPTTSQSQGDGSGSNNSKLIAENYMHLDDDFVVGIGDDITELVKRLINPQDDFHVLGIVGTGGAGKTTLASQIYRHTKVQSSFPHRAFVSISQQWSKIDLLHRISKEILGRSDDISLSETELLKELHDFMKDKRCLVVLDDIWKKEAWDDIFPIFPRTQGIKVILTTRIEEVPRYADTKCVLHEPLVLSIDQMWVLFSKGAVEGRHGIENNVKFEKLGKLMLQKCDGLPLTVVTLAGILRTKQHLYEWERVSEAFGGKILEGKGGFTYGVVEEMLELSYLDLPAHLKPVFMYLAVTREDQVWSSEELTQLLIAEGFVADDQIGICETLEDKGMQFISELAQRFIIRVKRWNHRNEVEYFYLHDLMRDFCIKKASECQFLENISPACPYERRGNKSRRVSIISREHSLEENNYTRTIVYRSLSNLSSDDGVIRKLESIHKNFKLLRVLSISDCSNKTLPKQIGNLIHLTYLSLVYTEISKLPESVRNLRNLIYLEFSPYLARGVSAKVPNDLVVNMVNLRVLILPDKLMKRSWGWGNCNRLGLSSDRHKKLHKFSCGASKWMMKDLPVMYLLNLTDLRITNIKEIEEMKAIHQCLSFLKDSLHLFFCEGVSKEVKFDAEILMGSQSLHALYLFVRLVDNCTIQFPSNLVKLLLSDCGIGEEVDLMGVLGQLFKLKYLSLGINAYLGTQLRCIGDSFAQLEELELRNLDNLEEWSVEEGAMHRLNKINIYNCAKLRRLPQGIRSIITLIELSIERMPEEFCRRLGYKKDEIGGIVQTQEGEDYYIIQHIPSVIIVHIE